ncbi:MAG: dynamin family protein [Gammaproteobacteria bacterium]
MGPSKVIQQRLARLESHLEQENDILVEVVRGFRRLDAVTYRMGMLHPDQSHATRIPWWPLITVLGTFSAGKSTFLNHYLGQKLQTTGTQAVDDKFTVMCFSADEQSQVLPGLALDADPRFPFYRVSREIERVAAGEGRRIDAYLQLKTSGSDRLRGKILIDSPGFDADAQRTSTLRITRHIIDLSDLVLVMFDARHPEPGAMQDTLRHLVEGTISRNDSNKFLYILNQMDATAREDNPEEVVAAWQRALAQKGLTAGRFYGIYNAEAATPIADENIRRRFEHKRDNDLAEIHARMQRVEVERAYRIVGALEQAATDIEERLVPAVRMRMAQWRRGVLIRDGAMTVIGGALVAGAVAAIGPDAVLGFLGNDLFAGYGMIGAGAVLAVIWFLLHTNIRARVADRVLRAIEEELPDGTERSSILGGFRRSSRGLRCIFSTQPAGWGGRARRKLEQLVQEANNFVQALNDRYTNPSGGNGKSGAAEDPDGNHAVAEEPSPAESTNPEEPRRESAAV